MPPDTIPGPRDHARYGTKPPRSTMRILAIESSARECSVAALDGQSGAARLICELPVTGGRTAQALAPTIKNLLDSVDWSVAAIELVAVTVGPGSFTGLRIGVTTAKTLAYAVGAQVIGVNTLAVLADQVVNADRALWTVIDAQRQELFAARFDGDQRCGRPPDRATLGAGSGDPRTTTTENPPSSADREQGTVPFPARTCTIPTHIITESTWLAQLQPGDLVTGPAVARVQSQLPPGVDATAPACWQPTASATGVVGWRDYQSGRRDDLWKLVPQYYRPSAAEEKRARQHP